MSDSPHASLSTLARKLRWLAPAAAVTAVLALVVTTPVASAEQRRRSEHPAAARSRAECRVLRGADPQLVRLSALVSFGERFDPGYRKCHVGPVLGQPAAQDAVLLVRHPLDRLADPARPGAHLRPLSQPGSARRRG
jgi:hypothetical protein